MIPACIGFEEVFSASALAKMRAMADTLEYRPATTQDADTQHRAGEVAWVDRYQRTDYTLFAERLDSIIYDVNDAHFHFDLNSLAELQFARYGVGDHFGWHMDMRGEQPPRKFALVIGLSEAGEYEGGRLEVQNGNHTPSFRLKAGMMIALPAWTLHRVTPITAGVRRTLVAWATGPQFR